MVSPTSRAIQGQLSLITTPTHPNFRLRCPRNGPVTPPRKRVVIPQPLNRVPILAKRDHTNHCTPAPSRNISAHPTTTRPIPCQRDHTRPVRPMGTRRWGPAIRPPACHLMPRVQVCAAGNGRCSASQRYWSCVASAVQPWPTFMARRALWRG